MGKHGYLLMRLQLNNKKFLFFNNIKVLISGMQIFIRLFILLLFLFSHSYGIDRIKIVQRGTTEYSIILSSNPSAIDSEAAFVLQKYIKKISGIILPVNQVSKYFKGGSIYIASTGHAEQIPFDINWQALEEDGFIIKTFGNHLLIAGGTDKGSLYGVYTFLEKYLGCRKFSPTVEVIPQRSAILLDNINDMEVPQITFRDAYFYDPEYMAWHKLDNHADIFGMYVHTSS